MARFKKHTPLLVRLNNKLVGRLTKKVSGAIEFSYDTQWLNWQHAIPASLSMPLREEVYKGDVVLAVFENLLPDSDSIRSRVAERVGAKGIDAYNLLSEIGKDCVGALQFIPENISLPPADKLEELKAIPISDLEIESLLKNLAQSPLGLNRGDDFRISVAGAQEKTALLWHKNRWMKPLGITPTTHIIKTQIGHLPNGIDLSNSVENEYYCLKLFESFGLKVNKVEMKTFGQTKALLIERFDRVWAKNGRLLRLPQEDLCQALSIPPTQKYQNEGGPGIKKILTFLKGSDHADKDQEAFLKAQIIFWLIGATDGHAKNFSVFLLPGGHFHMTPLYDVLTAQPSLMQNQINRKQMKLAMFVGNSRHYRLDKICGRHFVETAHKAGMRDEQIQPIIKNITDQAAAAFKSVREKLPEDFPEDIYSSVEGAAQARIINLKAALE